jgi:hypothetical protein
MKFDQLVNVYLSEKREEDSNEFTKKIADAAEAGKDTVKIGKKILPVKMSIKTANKIEGKAEEDDNGVIASVKKKAIKSGYKPAGKKK